MAKKMNYVDPQTGAVYPESTWLPLGIYTDFSGPTARVEFLGFATEAIARSMLMAVLGVPGGVKKAPVGAKSYSLTADQTRALAVAAPQGATMIDAMSYPAYDVAEETLDVPAPTAEDPDNKVSFFNDAVDVVLL